MADAKIEIKVGAVSFTGEGTETWLSAQLEKVIKHLPDLVTVAPPAEITGGAHHASPATKAGSKVTLAAFLGANDRKKSQARKFLATAVWLHDAGKDRLATRDVSEALSKANQGKLTNPAQSLNDNVGQGYCEKDGGRFYVTDEGKKAIG